MGTPQKIQIDSQLIYQRVRAAGGRMTVPTRLVINLLASGDSHYTADALIEAIEASTPGIAESTIYRVIQRLGELDIVEHVHSGNGPAFYHLSLNCHAHLVCSTCGSIIDIPESTLGPLARAVQNSYDFRIDPHHSALLGTCASCTP